MPHKAGSKLSCYGPTWAEVLQWDNAPTADFLAFIEAQRKVQDSNRPDGGISGSRALAAPGTATTKEQVPQAFHEHCVETFEHFNYGPIKEYRYWYGVTIPNRFNQHEKRFAHGFPHAHGWEGLTLIHYVQTADEGGDLVIVDEKHHNTLHRFNPKPGTSIIVDGYSLHGVEAVTGNTCRYTLICTAFHVDDHKPGYRDEQGRPVRDPPQ